MLAPPPGSWRPLLGEILDPLLSSNDFMRKFTIVSEAENRFWSDEIFSGFSFWTTKDFVEVNAKFVSLLVSVKTTVVFQRIVGKYDVDSKIYTWEIVWMYVYIFVSSSILRE